MRTTVIAAVLFALPAAAHANHQPPWPIQITVGGGSNSINDADPSTPPSVGVGAVWLGGVIPLERYEEYRRHGSLFFGPGGEATVEGIYGPYQWSAGGGMRLGYAWRGGLRNGLPDAYVYVRATPFMGFRQISDPAYLDDNASITKRGMGVRLGVGITAPMWSAFMLRGVGSGNSMHFHDPYEAVACCLIGIALVLINHAEVTYEIYNEPGIPTLTRVGFRIGTGF